MVSGDGKERETHDNFLLSPPLAAGQPRIVNYFIGLFLWVQVSRIVLENFIFLRGFIQACGEGEIVAVKARFCCAEGPSSLIPVLHHSLGHS